MPSTPSKETRSILAGIDTEYGFTVEGRNVNSQADDSIAFVRSSPDEGFLHWDYRSENPRQDMRGFQVDHLTPDPIDAEYDRGRARPHAAEERSDRILPNGARFYNDHGHPEYATPECWGLADIVAHEQFGDSIVVNAAQRFSQEIQKDVKVYKNNTDFHGSSWGTHESYLVPRHYDFNKLAQAIIPILIARQVVSGAGKVGSESKGPVKFQLSQRADFFVEAMNIETLSRRPVFNTRDEPHANANLWRRLHVISGDSNMHPGCTARKIGLIKLALILLEQDLVPLWRIPDPVTSFQLVSRDSTGEGRIELEDRNWTTPRQVLESYCDAMAHADIADPEIHAIIAETRQLLEDRHANHDNFWPKVDWAAKLWLLNQFAESGEDWDQATMQSLDMQYHLLDQSEGLYFGLQSANYLVLPPFASLTPQAVPEGSRAIVRAILIQRFREELESISWSTVRLKSGEQFSLDPSIWYESDLFNVESIEELRKRISK
ncbi:MAG: proteasome accessory factor PafA2 family protein [Fimbriimonadaceae bacterium]